MTYISTDTDRQTGQRRGLPPPKHLFLIVPQSRGRRSLCSQAVVRCSGPLRQLSAVGTGPHHICALLHRATVQRPNGWMGKRPPVCLFAWVSFVFFPLSLFPPSFFPSPFPPFPFILLNFFFFSVINLIIFGTDSACGRGKRVCNHISCGCCIASWWAEGYHDV